MVAATPSPLDFRPDDALAHRIVADLAEPTASLASVAESHQISVAALSLWLNSPQARHHFDTIESGVCRHVRFAASLHLTKAVGALVQILDDYRTARVSSSAPAVPLDAPLETPPASMAAPSPSQPHSPSAPPRDADSSAASAFSSLRLELRHAEIARKAADHLYRLSRFTPLTDDQIALAAHRAAATREARRAEREASDSGGTTLQSDGSALGGTALQGSDSGGSPPSPSSPSSSPSAPSSLSRVAPSSPSPRSHFPLPDPHSPVPSPPWSSVALSGERLSPSPPSSASSSSSPFPPPLPTVGGAHSPLPSSPRSSASSAFTPSSRSSRSNSPARRPADLIRAATGPPIPVGASP